MLSTCIIFTLNIDRDYLCAESLDKKKQKFDPSEWKTEIAKVSNDIMQCIQREPVLSLSSIFLSLSHIFLSLIFFLLQSLSPAVSLSIPVSSMNLSISDTRFYLIHE